MSLSADRDGHRLRRWMLEPSTARMATAAALTALVAIALWLRFQFILIYGGFEASYQGWANLNYFGPITGSYLGAAEAIRGLARYPGMAYPPGYPGFLALLQFLGFDDLQRLRHVQASLDALVVPLVYDLVRRAGAGRVSSFAAAVFYAACPALAIGAGLLLAEGLSPGIMVFSLWLGLWAGRAPTPARLLALGAWLALAALIRPDFLLLAAFIGAWLWLTGRVRWRPILLAAYAVGFALVIVPWGLFNRVNHGAWVFGSTGGSAGLWEGLGEVPNPYGYILGDERTMVMLRERGLGWQSREADRFLLQDYVRAWREHPDFVIRVIARRWRTMLTESEPIRTDWLLRIRSALDKGGVYLWILSVVVVAGNASMWLVGGVPVAYALASIGMVHYEPRYVRYIQLFYVIAALLAASSLFARARGRLRLALAGAGLTAWVVTGAVAARGLPSLHREVQSALLRKSVDDRAVLGALAMLSGAEWVPEAGASLEPTEAGWSVRAPGGGRDFIATRLYQVPPADFVVLTYDVVLARGGVTIGILDSSGRWVDSRSYTAARDHRGSLAVDWHGDRSLKVVLARADSDASETACVVRETSVRIRVR